MQREERLGRLGAKEGEGDTLAVKSGFEVIFGREIHAPLALTLSSRRVASCVSCMHVLLALACAGAGAATVAAEGEREGGC